MSHTTGVPRPLLFALLLIALLAISGSATLAHAGTLEIEPGGTVTAESLVEFEHTIFNLGGPRVTCPMTLTLELRSAEKTLGVQFGSVTRARVGTCSEGATVRFLGLPWAITYEGITGGLPSEINEVLMKFHGVQILISASCWACLYEGDINARLPLLHVLPEEPYVNQLLILSDSLLVAANLLPTECPPFIVFLSVLGLEPTQRIIDV